MNGAIAQGAMFVVKGANLGPTAAVVASAFPLQTAIGGSSVRIVVSGMTLDAILYYSLNQQVAAILPSNAPAGTGQLTVTYQGRTSASYAVKIVASNIGIYTLNSTGSGPAIATLADNSLITETNAPNPGDVIVVYGNGLGPVTFDETRPAPGGDLTNVALEAFAGDKPATVLYRGRNTCCTSLDQINLRLPDGVSGCGVSLLFKIGGLVSNMVRLPIAASGRTCETGLADLPLSAIQAAVAKGGLQTGRAVFIQNDASTANPTRLDFVQFSSFVQPKVYELIDALVGDPGGCSVSAGNGESAPAYTPSLKVVPILNAGNLTFTPASGAAATLPPDSGGYYVTSANGIAPAGQYRASLPASSPLGAVEMNVTIPAPFRWTNKDTFHTAVRQGVKIVDRSKPLNITWSGASPGSIVWITGTATIGAAPLAATSEFYCRVSAASGGFTIPPHALLSLTPGARAGVIYVENAVGGRAANQGRLDLIRARYSASESVQVNYE